MQTARKLRFLERSSINSRRLVGDCSHYCATLHPVRNASLETSFLGQPQSPSSICVLNLWIACTSSDGLRGHALVTRSCFYMFLKVVTSCEVMVLRPLTKRHNRKRTCIYANSSVILQLLNH